MSNIPQRGPGIPLKPCEEITAEQREFQFISNWSADNIRNSYRFGFYDGMTPAGFASEVLKLPFEMRDWARSTFPGETVGRVESALLREVNEVRAAIAEYVKYHSPDNEVYEPPCGPRAQARAEALALELADMCIVAMRFIAGMGFDAHQVIWKKAKEVQRRVYDSEGNRVH